LELPQMLESRDRDQDDLFVAGSLSDLIPSDYILKRVDRVLDLSWVRAEVEEHYNTSFGRPGIDPEAALRLMLAGFFMGIVHDRKLMREAQMHIGIRWFAGYKLHERLPDHSSLTRIRDRWGKQLFQKLFERVVEQCIKAKLVSGDTVHVDATLIPAHSNWLQYARRHAQQTVDENPLPDSEAALTRKADGTRVFGYKQHTAVDSDHGVVVDCEVTPANQNEGEQLIDQVQRIEQTLDGQPKTVTADASYGHARNYEELEQRGIEPMIVPQRRRSSESHIPVSKFKYDAHNDIVRCPAGRILRPSSRSDRGMRYCSRASDCRGCPLRSKCIAPNRSVRTVTIVAGYTALLRARRRHLKQPISEQPIYVRHKWQVEGRHSEAKNIHSMARAVRCGIEQVRIQALLTAASMNLKRLAVCLGGFLHPKTSITVTLKALHSYLNPIKQTAAMISIIFAPPPSFPTDPAAA
jgi:transposase